MDIRLFLKNSKLKKQIKREKSIMSKKIKQRKKLIELMGNALNENIIDTIDYNRMVGFMKKGGVIVNMGEYNRIIDKVKTSNNEELKEKFINHCKTMFSHLHSLIDGDTINTKIISDNIIKYNKEISMLTDDQIVGIDGICKFLYDPNRYTYGLYGYAGSGKTTLITKLVHYLVLKNYLRSVTFTAPTNKAVKVMKGKFKEDIDDLVHNNDMKSGESLNTQLEKLEDRGFFINFMTIHKLLGYQIDFNYNGDRIFTKGKMSLIKNYDLVIIDECSMVSMEVINDLFEDIRETVKRKSGHIPKILFVGDPAQLPPVNEKVSIIFAKNSVDFDLKHYEEIVHQHNSSITNKTVLSKFNDLKKDILNQKYTMLETIVRSSDKAIIGLCNNVREWVLGIINNPTINHFKGKKIKYYKYKKGDKTDNMWFKTCFKYFKDIKNVHRTNNIMLTWTNKQSDKYNSTMRKMLFEKKQLRRYEIGDILILKDFYNIKSNNKQINFHTSEQIKVIKIEERLCAQPEFLTSLHHISHRIYKLKGYKDIEQKYIKTVLDINKNTDRKYNIWKLYVHKLSDISTGEIPHTYTVYSLKKNDISKLAKDKDYAANKIKELRKYYNIFHKDRVKTIDNDIVRKLWKEWNSVFVDKFAQIDYGISVTTHKSQGSTFHNVFVDADDILENRDNNVGKRCIYTALTRTSNELHILI